MFSIIFFGILCLSAATQDKTCPEREPTPGMSCSEELVPEECSWGTETCCGATHPSIVGSCENGEWSLQFTDACLGPSLFGCPPSPVPTPAPTPTPETVPTHVAECGECTDDRIGVTCSSGSETCCGETFKSFTATCEEGGQWFGFFTEACFGPSRFGCPSTQIPTPEPTPTPETVPTHIKECGECTDERIGQSCSSGSETCCGETHVSFTATCEEGGQWFGRFTDACRSVFEFGCPSPCFELDRAACRRKEGCNYVSIPPKQTVGGLYNPFDTPEEFCVEFECSQLTRRHPCESTGECFWMRRGGKRGCWPLDLLE